jgi:hypothetical protein
MSNQLEQQDGPKAEQFETDYERIVLHCFFASHGLIKDSGINESDFLNPKHKQIFRVMNLILSEGDIPELVAVSERMIDDSSYLSELSGLEGCSTANINFYSKKLKSRSKIIELRRAAESTLDSLNSPDHDLDKIIDSLQKAIQLKSHGSLIATGKIKIWNQTELMNTDFPKMEWLVYSLIPKGNVVVLAGAPKLGKSWMALALGDAVATGGSFLGFNALKAQVLILSLETSPARDAGRFRKMGITPNDNLFIAHEWPKGAEGFAKIREWLDSHPQAGMILADTWVKLADRHDMNDYSAVSHETGTLKAIAAEYDVTIGILTHTRKGSQSEDAFDAIMGSQGLSGIADTMMVMRKRRGAHEASLNVTGREITENEFVLKFDPDVCTWEMVGNSSEVAEHDSSQPILDYLKEHGDSNTQAIADAVGKSKQNTSNILGRMADKGQIVKISRGVYNLPLETPFTSFTSLHSDLPETETINGEYTSTRCTRTTPEPEPEEVINFEIF